MKFTSMQRRYMAKNSVILYFEKQFQERSRMKLMNVPGFSNKI